jgi:hypothetical protein
LAAALRFAAEERELFAAEERGLFAAEERGLFAAEERELEDERLRVLADERLDPELGVLAFFLRPELPLLRRSAICSPSVVPLGVI